MDKFQKKFLEEATDLINELEDSLLKLEVNPNNQELIEKVFRAMHTLKGGGAMFGFEKVSGITHHLESLYEDIRDNRILLASELLSLSLEILDLIKSMLFDDKYDESVYDSLLEKIISYDYRAKEKIKEDNDDDSNNNIPKDDKDGSGMNTFFIVIHPDESIFDNGTNPLYLLDELCEIGKCASFPLIERIPVFDQLNPEKCLVDWNVLLATDKNENDIQDVFIFVEDDCRIEIIKLVPYDIFEHKGLISQIEENYKKTYSIDKNFIIQELTKNVNTTIKSEESKVSKTKTEETVVSDVTLPDRKSATTANISSIRVAAERIDDLMNLVSELVTTQARLSLYSDNQDSSELTIISENIQKLSRQLRDLAFSISLIPINSILTRFQRLVRDLSKELNKDISFTAEGTDTELDKTIIENLTDPILHIIRNSIDHGLESEEERLANGKSKTGNINMRAFHSGAHVLISISDDGKGIDPIKIKNKAISKGLIPENTDLPDKEIFDFLFLPGFSTAEKVTDISGRGVGMDVVNRKIQEVRGDVSIDSELGKGTTITISLPLTLSIIDGLLVRVEQTDYILPLNSVMKCYAVTPKDLDDNYQQVVVLDEEQIPFQNLRKEFKLESEMPEVMHVIIVSYDEFKVGIAVDNIIGEYQAVLKPLGKLYKDQDIFSGASILGDGSVALVVDPNKMIKKFSNDIITSN